MKKLIICIIFSCFFIFQSTVYAQTATAVVKAFKKVEATAKSNIYGKDFLSVYAEAKAEADLYLENPASKKQKKLREEIEIINKSYDWAAKLWTMKMSGVPYIHESDDFCKLLYAEFPESKKDLRGTINFSEAIGWMYGNASTHLSTATKLLFKK